MINTPNSNVANQMGRTLEENTGHVIKDGVNHLKNQIALGEKALRASVVAADGLVDRPIKNLIPTFSILQQTPAAGSTLPAEFDGFLSDIKKFGSEINRIKDQLSKTTDPAERAALFAELQFNMNQQSETVSIMSKMLQDLHQNAQTILQNIGR